MYSMFGRRCFSHRQICIDFCFGCFVWYDIHRGDTIAGARAIENNAPQFMRQSGLQLFALSFFHSTPLSQCMKRRKQITPFVFRPENNVFRPIVCVVHKAHASAVCAIRTPSQQSHEAENPIYTAAAMSPQSNSIDGN